MSTGLKWLAKKPQIYGMVLFYDPDKILYEVEFTKKVDKDKDSPGPASPQKIKLSGFFMF